MGSFNRDDRSGGGRGPRDFGRKGFGGRDPGAKPAFKYDATCSKCGKACQVPFKPAGDRPVFCRDCFDKPMNGGQARPLTSSFNRPRFEDKQMFDATCAKCGNKCQVPFRPIDGKPIFCSNCFEKKGPTGDGASLDQLKQQFGMLHAKLDAILKALSATPSTPQAVKAVKSASAKGGSALGGKTKEAPAKIKTAKKPVAKKKK